LNHRDTEVSEEGGEEERGEARTDTRVRGWGKESPAPNTVPITVPRFSYFLFSLL
jgi:hypothetical protein